MRKEADDYVKTHLAVNDAAACKAQPRWVQPLRLTTDPAKVTCRRCEDLLERFVKVTPKNAGAA